MKEKPKNGIKIIISIKLNEEEEEVFKDTLLFFDEKTSIGCPNLIRKKDLKKYITEGELKVVFEILKLEVI